MTKQFENKVALVTGGSSGIGQATALKFAQEGAKVVVADLNIEGGHETLNKIKDMGEDAIFVRTDVTNSSEIKLLVKETVDVFGKLDCAFNNAGISGEESFTAEYDEDIWDQTININLRGIWLCMKYELIQMLKQGNGAIVNSSSMSGLVAFTGASAYFASKGGVIQITRTAALEYATKGIRINAVCPGVIKTPMTDRMIENDEESKKKLEKLIRPIGRMGKPEEVSEAVVWLCSDAASFVNGHSLVVDGGMVVQYLYS